MLNIHISDSLFTAYDVMLEDESFTEEVVVEATMEPFHLTCSIGHDRQGQYVTWNLRFYNAFIETKTIRTHNAASRASDLNFLKQETSYKFRQLLCKTANRSGSIAEAARERVHQLYAL